jgi:hypothetical protein
MQVLSRIILAGLLASTGAYGQDTTDTLPAATPQTENGITYVCGGIGAEEAARMKRESAHYNLMLTFAEHNGEYLADVGVGIADDKGKPLFHTVCGGPILLVNFSRPGDYKVTAEVAGQSVSQVVHISKAKGAMVALVWPRAMDNHVASDL